METFYIILTLLSSIVIIFAVAILVGIITGLNRTRFDDRYYNAGKIRKEDY